jgi:hypothetical protein
VSGKEASIWQLDPAAPWKATRIAEMDRNVVAPAGLPDGDRDDLGDWESSGILDVTHLFDTAPGETPFDRRRPGAQHQGRRNWWRYRSDATWPDHLPQ